MVQSYHKIDGPSFFLRLNEPLQ